MKKNNNFKILRASDNEYRDYFALNSSSIKAYNDGGMAKVWMGYGEKEVFKIGNYADCLLTTPNLINESFHIETINAETVEMFRQIKKKNLKLPEEPDEEFIKRWCIKDGKTIFGGSAKKVDTIYDQLDSKGIRKAYQAFLKNPNITFISESSKRKGIENAEKVNSNPIIQEFLDKDLKHAAQVFLKFNWPLSNGIRCKSLLDYVVVKDGYLHVIDFKTDGNTEEIRDMQKVYSGEKNHPYWNTIIKFGYHIQACFYSIAVVANFDFFKEHFGEPNLKMGNFYHITMFKKYDYAEMFKLSPINADSNDLNVLSYHGWEHEYDSWKNFKGVNPLVHEMAPYFFNKKKWKPKQDKIYEFTNNFRANSSLERVY